MSRYLALVLFAAACGTTSDAAPATKQSTSPAPDACIQVMTKNRTCTEEFIPALVDSRAKLDTPAGIKDQVAKDRDGVIAKAKVEWAEDSKDENIAKMCAHMPADLSAANLDAAKACLAKDACGEYVACITPVFEKHLAK
jgi:hypothetical protein